MQSGRGGWSTRHNQSATDIPVGRQFCASDTVAGRQCASVRSRSDDRRVMSSCSWRGLPGVERTRAARSLSTTYSEQSHHGLLRAGRGCDLQPRRVDVTLHQKLTAVNDTTTTTVAYIALVQYSTDRVVDRHDHPQRRLRGLINKHSTSVGL